MTGRFLILEPSLYEARGHQALAAERFAALIGPAKTHIVAGVGWNGPRWFGGCAVLPLFKRHRAEVARLRRYGPVMGRIISTTELVAAPMVALLRRQTRNHQQFPVASADAKGMRPIMTHDLMACLRFLNASRDDHVFIPSADAEMLLAVAALLEAEDPGSSIHLRLMYDDVGNHVTDPTWRSALEVLLRAPRARDRVHLLVETSAFARAVGEITGSEVTLLPHPSPLPTTAAPALGDEFIYYLAGEARADKGVDLVPEVMKVLSARSDALHTRLRLRVHGQRIASCQGIKIERVAPHVSNLEYARNWQQAHAALLLHDPGVYRLRGSGAVCDAVASGRPFVCLKDSSLAEWGAHGNAVVAERRPSAIVEAMCQLIDNYQEHAAASALAAAAFPALLRAGLSALLE